MKEADETRREVRKLRERLSRLSEASLRISESLDLKTVLHEVLESARALTGARTALILTLDSSGKAQDFITCGLTPRERQWFREMPLGPRLCEYALEVASRPVRMKDMSAHLCSVGFPKDPAVLPTFLAVPIRHQGIRLGNFYLADKQTGPEFTIEDEEVLTMFSFQAGAAIANAREHRDVLRARADLAALIDMSPVAVLVFDARSRNLASANLESRRIANRLGLQGLSTEQVLQMVTARSADGRPIVDEGTTLPQANGEARDMRAEEIIIQAPSGYTIRALLSVTHIRAGDGTIKSIVATVQDLTPREELERLRTDFLGLVSHELRAPLTSIKGCSTSVLGASRPFGPAEMLQFFRIVDDQADQMGDLIADLLDVVRIDTGTLAVAPEPEEVGGMVDQARNTFLSGGGRQPIHVDLPPDLPLVVADRQRVVQILDNLLSNAGRHSPEDSVIRVAASPGEGHIAVTVTDEGRGIGPGRLPYLFRKFARSGREKGEERVGAGLGLAICRGLVEAQGGRIWAESEGENLGARFTFTLPVVDADRAGAAPEPAPAPDPGRSGTGRPRVLVVDDDPQTLVYVRSELEAAGYEPVVTGDVDEVPRLLKKTKPQLVLLDLILPGTDGIELMQRTPALADRPVIFLSGYGRGETIARALEAGAADYIVKPFSATELVARIQAALRGQSEPSGAYRVGALQIDYDERLVRRSGTPVPLTALEYDLLRTLVENAGRVSTYEYLLRRVWSSDHSGDTRPVRACVKKLRRKLGDDARNPQYIFTERSVGYRMARPDAEFTEVSRLPPE